MIDRLNQAAIRVIALLGALWLISSSAMAAGTIPLSMTQQFDQLGRPLSGGKLEAALPEEPARGS